MKAFKKVYDVCTVSLMVTVLFVLTSCSHSPKKPEWVDKGAERDTSRGMIRHTGIGTGRDKDIAIFQARQNAIQAAQFECAGINLKKTVVRKSWVEPVMDTKDDEKVAYYQGHVVVEVDEDDCDKANTPGKSQAEAMGENERVRDAQDTYERVMKVRNGLPDDYYLKQRAIAATYAMYDEMYKKLELQQREHEYDMETLRLRLEAKTGKDLSPEPPGPMEVEINEDIDKLYAKYEVQGARLGGKISSVTREVGDDEAHPALAPLYELAQKMRERGEAIKAGKLKSLNYNFESEFARARGESQAILNGIRAERRNLGHYSPAEDPSFTNPDKVTPTGLPKVQIPSVSGLQEAGRVPSSPTIGSGLQMQESNSALTPHTPDSLASPRE